MESEHSMRANSEKMSSYKVRFLLRSERIETAMIQESCLTLFATQHNTEENHLAYNILHNTTQCRRDI